ncbi:MAG: phytanoyl-CoA dioxygenase family protein [Myxococcales bacterium]|nr:phytanoyl-CoA dioxygenase family protein [Myxococcales bacterium]
MAAESFRRDGYARLGRLLDDVTLASLRRRSDALMLGEIVHEGMFFQHDSATGRYEDLDYKRGYVGPSLGYRKLEKLELDPVFRAHIDHPRFARVVRRFIDGPIAIYRATLFNKSATGGSPLPWHQDGGTYWGIEPAPFLQVWTALDDCGLDAGCLEVVAGSHAGGLVSPLGGVIQHPVERLEGQVITPLPAEAGEVMLIHNDLWHCAGVNRSGRPRRTISVCYMTATTRCLRTRRAPRQFYRAFQEAPGPAARDHVDVVSDRRG